ncbi:MAG: hypothetical protein AAFV25_15220 [Bacteroidota bacterium]
MRLSLFRLITLLILGLLPMAFVQGQGCCSGGSPISGNLNIGAANSRSFSLNLTYDYNHLADLVSGSKELDDKLRRRINHSVLLRVKYAFSDRLSLIALFNLIRQEERVRSTSPNAEDTFRKAEGVGDIITVLQYQLWRAQGHTLILAGGLKWPTGRTTIADEETGIVLNPDLQPGTGSYDFTASLYYGMEHWLFNGNRLNATFTYRISSEAERFNGLQTYQFGDELFVDIGISFPVVLAKQLLYPEFSFRYRYQTEALNDRAGAPNTGGHWLYATPGFRWAFNNRWSAFAFSEIPIYRNLVGVQLTTSYRVGAGIQYDIRFQDAEKEAKPQLF